jgi:hypothetical protein
LVDRTSFEIICWGPIMDVSSLGTVDGFDAKIEPPARLLDERDLSSSTFVSYDLHSPAEIVYHLCELQLPLE